MCERSSILLSLNPTTGYERHVLAGVFSHMLPHNNWTVYLINPDDAAVHALPSLKFDGVIGRFHGALGGLIQKLGVPTIITSSGVTEFPEIPRFIPDNQTIGRTAADCLMLLGMKHFAYVGAPMLFSQTRHKGFEQALALAGKSCHVYPNDDSELRWWEPQREHLNLRAWIRDLPKPVGIFCGRDLVALCVTEVCRQEGIDIPNDAALIGVDNDDLICRMCNPQLTSISSPAQEIGFQAAAALDDWMRNGLAPPPNTAISNAGIVERGSTAVSHIEDPLVKKAIAYLRENLEQNLDIGAAASAVGVRRRTLERRFRSILNRSIHDEITRARVDRAKELLSRTDLALKVIARKSGFAASERFFVVFRKMTGETPHAYRVKFKDNSRTGYGTPTRAAAPASDVAPSNGRSGPSRRAKPNRSKSASLNKPK